MDAMNGGRWESRAMLFRMLARGLTCPDKDMCEAIADGSFAVEAQGLFGAGAGSHENGQDFEELLEELARTAETPGLLETLRREYTRLFTAPQGALIPIWETIFLDPDKTQNEFGAILIRSREAADARSRYEAASVSMATRESADHMRIECEFTGYLCQRVQLAANESERDSWAEHLDGFVSVHLDRWFKPFFDTLATCARHPFYRAVAVLGQLVDVGKLRK
ncbi:TorD/DmsD family molecular chaperone [Raoultibacter massiliensis]|uniref:Molecular chaperone TorD family protein n=2 Tax=Raoultibacter massiliensis TaxID=1852371 RepID=A0ABV1JEX4_9ACTN|nr:molecular chaperone TorD family protein [Raoultibacter massiliensis]